MLRQKLYEFLITQVTPKQFNEISSAYNNDFSAEAISYDLKVSIEIVRGIYFMRDLDFKNHDEENRWFSQWRADFKAQNNG